MQLFTLLSVILACIVAASAIPLQLTDLQGQAIEPWPQLEQALRDANGQIQLMLKTINDAMKNPPDAAAMGRIKMAFGPNPRMENIERNIRFLDTGVMRVLKSKDKTIFGKTQWTNPRDPRTIQTLFGIKIFESASDDARTFAVVHEATHYLFRAGDDYEDNGSATRMLPFTHTYFLVKEHLRVQGGYALKEGYHNPLRETDFLDLFIRVRNTAPNMDVNADSYSLLGLICTQLERTQLQLSRGTNHPSGSGEPSGSGGATTSARPVTPSGSGGSHQEDPSSPTMSTRPVTPNPAGGSQREEPGSPTTSTRPVTPNPASGSGRRKPRKLVKRPPARPVTPNPASGSGREPRKLVKRPPARSATPNPASGSGNA